MGARRAQVLLLLCMLMLRACARRALPPLRARAVAARTAGVRALADLSRVGGSGYGGNGGNVGGESFAKLVRRSLPPLSVSPRFWPV